MTKKRAETEAQRKGRLNRERGIRGELSLIKRLKQLGFHGMVSSRSESKNLDNAGIDIVDKDNCLPCNFQIKTSLANPQYTKLISECPIKDKPLAVYHNKQYKVENSDKQRSGGSYIIYDADFGLELLRVYSVYLNLIQDNKKENNYEQETSD